MTDQDLAELAQRAEGLPLERKRQLQARLPRWGDLYDLNGIVEGLRCACALADEEGREPGSLWDLTGIAAAELLKGRGEVARVRALPSLRADVTEVARLDQIITSGLRAGKPLADVMKEVDEHQKGERANARDEASQTERT